ncbi:MULTISPECIES: exodeoxyribonuclease VII small subunit [Anaerolinea]|uniref:exodeoxyribonuclease VII small subunit n=1 Tax=Anaerolinea TaxID=233189 RepID=UPI00260A996A|nr:exodeoxyribonuclease VII small subunit [Anaerolinea thermophila]
MEPSHDFETLSFEDAMRELEAILEKLETAQPSLEETLSLYERGQALAKHCATLLEQAEVRIQMLNGSNGTELG